jgi:hypothetical protein
MNIGNIFIFTLQECIQNVLLIVPKLEEGSLKMWAISCLQKYFILISASLFPGLGEYAGLSLERIVFACF